MRCAVLGRPIAHSLSPALHRAAYASLGLDDWTYDRFEVGETELGDFVEGCGPEWRGLSLTMPLKVVALSLGEPDAVAARVQAANTMILEPAGRRVYNTDVEGLVAALRRAGLERAERVTLVGSGATARSAVASLAELGTRQLQIVARSADRARPTAEFARELELEVAEHPFDGPVPAADLLIATVVAGAIGEDRSAEFAASAPVVFDAIYDPWPTPLAVAAQESGRTVVNGLDLLVGQAVVQLRLMTGAEVDPEVLYSAGRAELSGGLA